MDQRWAVAQSDAQLRACWDDAARWAGVFWGKVVNDPNISAEFQAIGAARCGGQ